MITYHNRAVLAPNTRASCRATPTLCDCLLDSAQSHALGGSETAPVIGAFRISCRPPGPLEGLAASMLAACVSSAGQIV